MRVCALLRAAGSTAGSLPDEVEVDSGEPSEEGDAAVAGETGISFVPPEEEIANAECALAVTPEGAADAEPQAAAGGSRGRGGDLV